MKVISYNIKKSKNNNKVLSIVVPTTSTSLDRFKKLKNSVYKNAEHVDINIVLNAVEDHGTNFNFSRSVNRGLQELDADFYLNVNDDIILNEMAFYYSLKDFEENYDLGLLGALLYLPNGKIAHAGIKVIKGPSLRYLGWYITFSWIKDFPFYSINKIIKLKSTFRSNNIKEYYGTVHYRNINKNHFGLITGAYHFFTKEVYHFTNGYDENYKMGLEDIDFCIKILKNNKIIRMDAQVKGVHTPGSSGLIYTDVYYYSQIVYLIHKYPADEVVKLVEKNGNLFL